MKNPKLEYRWLNPISGYCVCKSDNLRLGRMTDMTKIPSIVAVIALFSSPMLHGAESGTFSESNPLLKEYVEYFKKTYKAGEPSVSYEQWLTIRGPESSSIFVTKYPSLDDIQICEAAYDAYLAGNTRSLFAMRAEMNGREIAKPWCEEVMTLYQKRKDVKDMNEQALRAKEEKQRQARAAFWERLNMNSPTNKKQSSSTDCHAVGDHIHCSTSEN